MREVWFLLAGCLAVVEVYLAWGTNTGSPAPLQNDLRFAALGIAPVLVLAFFSARESRAGGISRGTLALLALGALVFGLAGFKVALLLGLVFGGWFGAFAAGCAWLVSRSKA